MNVELGKMYKKLEKYRNRILYPQYIIAVESILDEGNEEGPGNHYLVHDANNWDSKQIWYAEDEITDQYELVINEE